MPTVEQNLHQWANHDWSSRGDEWSQGWGNTTMMWHGTVLPRICHFLPAAHILEIAPGHGRCTQFLLPHCREITLVDLVPECIKACTKRFRRAGPRVRGYVNNGRSLEMVRDGSIDFVFSWDSLVHVEEDVMREYVTQIGRKLKPGGTGFLHHSNIGAYTDATGRLLVENKNWRGASMSAARFRQFAAEAGLATFGQELVEWGQPAFIDCISAFGRPPAGASPRAGYPVPVVENPRIFEEGRWIAQLATLYRPGEEHVFQNDPAAVAHRNGRH